MSTTAQRKALEVLSEKVKNTKERYPGYHEELTDKLICILKLITEQPHNIRQKVSQQVTALGKNLVDKKGNLE